MEHRSFADLRDALRLLRAELPALRDQCAGRPMDGPWQATLERNVLPALDFDLPVLLVAICGGGSTGKSTLLNALAGAELSQVAFRAGLTARVILAGHPDVLTGAHVAERLLHRLGQAPVPWVKAELTAQPGPPIYATSRALPRNLLLLDTPDFDTGENGRLANRERAEPVLRTAEALIYVFTNAVYANLSNTAFMRAVVGGVGGRPTVLVYRVSRVASDAEALEHCRQVARRLYGGEASPGFPPEVIGVYRVHESDAVAEGRAQPALVPLGPVTAGRPLPELLAGLDVTAIKRHVLASDLHSLRLEAGRDLTQARQESLAAQLYGQCLRHAKTEHALQALRDFPAQEALALATRLLIETGPPAVRALRRTADWVAAPLRGMQALGRRAARWARRTPAVPTVGDPASELAQHLLEAANALRNRLLDDALVVSVSEGDGPWASAQAMADERPTWLTVEPVGRGRANLHVRAPRAVLRRQAELLDQDWPGAVAQLERESVELMGLPAEMDAELRQAVLSFRQGMGWWQRLREGLSASAAVLPPLLGVTYTLLTGDPVTGGGLWIRLGGLLGLNDLWALVAIPASLGLGEQDRRHLEEMLAPVFRAWLGRRAARVAELFGELVCQPVEAALRALPAPDDARFQRLAQALEVLEEEST